MFVSPTVVVLSISLVAYAFPQEKGVRIVAPPKPSNTGILQIPDHAHPYIAPGSHDLRGPCPGLNTLANHGYLPRNGVASFAEIIDGTTKGFNMDYDLASGFAAFGILASGNAYLDKLSIGLDTPLIPPLPGKIDGPKTRGLGFHGRFEGDISMTRQDVAIGDNNRFQPELFDELLSFVARYGNDSTVTGPKSIVNEESLSLFRKKRFEESQANNPKLQYPTGRLFRSYGESGFALKFFANGTDDTLSVPTMTSFFRNERFPAHWYRSSSPGTLAAVGVHTNNILTLNPVPAGYKAPNGTYVLDTTTVDDCFLYNNLAGDNVPGALLNTTGVLKENVDFLLNTINNLFSGCPAAVPHAGPNV
ncbi:hypothetical protein H0H87_008434 [Tephrocybe sp. NHM501043]|nr:hypothetical protein H0H87_008434 [Tephrocybe sp. NHM501043]